MIFVTADHHFGHKNIIKYCDRPFRDIGKMNKAFIRKWNYTVGTDDTVYYLGDFALTPVWYAQNIMDKLNGYKILIRGNHDGSVTRMKRIGFHEVYNEPYLFDKNKCIFFSHNPIANSFNVNVGVDVWDYAPVELNKALSLVPDYIWRRHRVVLCGHVHNNWVTRFLK